MDTENAPLVTIITPSYNRAGYLAETIDSVLAQDYPNIEYIILDDGSTDDTAAVLDQYAGREGVIIERHDNMGEVPTVNKGYRMARGDYIAIVNSDDPVLPGFISTAVAYMKARPELLVAYPDWQEIDEDSNVRRTRRTYDYDYTNMLRWHYCIPGSGAIIRRRALEIIPQRNPALRYSADFDYWLQIGLHGPMGRIPETLATFRIHPDSATVSKKGQQMVDEHIKLIDNVYRHHELPADVVAARAEAYGAAYYIAGTVWLGSDTPQRAKAYFLRAILRYPPALWRWSPERRRTIAQTLLPAPLNKLGGGIRRAVHWARFQFRCVRDKLRLILRKGSGA